MFQLHLKNKIHTADVNKKEGQMNKIQSLKSLTVSDTLILQKISESGLEELETIATELREPVGRIRARLSSLRHLGLIKITYEYGLSLIALTQKGKMTINYVWT